MKHFLTLLFFGIFLTVYTQETYYTSDYDLSPFYAHQLGGELKIAPVLGIWQMGEKSYLKNIILRFQHYQRNINFNANIITVDFNFVL